MRPACRKSTRKWWTGRRHDLSLPEANYAWVVLTCGGSEKGFALSRRKGKAPSSMQPAGSTTSQLTKLKNAQSTRVRGGLWIDIAIGVTTRKNAAKAPVGNNIAAMRFATLPPLARDQ